jgi:hypothetical protein
MSSGMIKDRSLEETDDPLYADDRKLYKVEKWSRDGQRTWGVAQVSPWRYDRSR